MRIALEQPVYLGGSRGVGTYARNLVRALARLPGDDEFLLFGFFFKDFERKLEQVERPADPRFKAALQRWPESLTTALEWERGVPVIDSYCRLRGVDVYHCPALRLPRLSRAVGVLSVHDLIGEVRPDLFPPEAREGWSRRSREQVRRAALVLASSDCAKRDLMERYGVAEDRIRRVYLGVDHEAFRPSAGREGLRAKFGLRERFLISVGPWEPRRNLETELKAFKLLVSRPETSDCGLVLTGSVEGAYPETLKRLAAELGLAERVTWTGYVGQAELAGLYSLASGFVYPSWYDGYNLPMLEAMACGTPVAVSKAGVLPELGGGACLLFAPGDAEEQADCLRRLLTDASLASELRRKGLARAAEFQWDKTARQTLDAFHAARG